MSADKWLGTTKLRTLMVLKSDQKMEDFDFDFFHNFVVSFLTNGIIFVVVLFLYVAQNIFWNSRLSQNRKELR